MHRKKHVSFLAGPNGSGKTRMLCSRSKETIRNKEYSIAISNTPFSRFPRRSKNFDVLKINGNNQLVNSLVYNFETYLAEEESSFSIPDFMEYIGFYPQVELAINLGENKHVFLVDLISTGTDQEELKSALMGLLSSESPNFLIRNTADSFKRSLSDKYNIIFKYLPAMKSIGIILSYELMFRHPVRGHVSFNQLSSGEKSLIATFLFVKNQASKAKYLYIDEPENSLHPNWQKKYIEILHMAIGYNDISIVVATHSPIIMSGGLSSHGKYVNIYKVDNGHCARLDLDYKSEASSIEKILWDIFDTVTPVNHYLSVEVSSLLNEMINGDLELDFVKNELNSFLQKSYDEKQKRVLDDLISKLPRLVEAKDE